MDLTRRRFMEGCAAAVGGTLMTQHISGAPVAQGAAAGAQDTGSGLTNWAGNLRYGTDKVTHASSIPEVQQFVRSHDHFKVLGSRHCFNSIADSTDQFLSLENLREVGTIEPGSRTVTVQPGIRYGHLCPVLDGKGLALHNLASLPHISIAGAIATATHGSGIRNGNLATQVSAIEFIAADGTVVSLSRDRDRDQFNGAVVHLGALGVLTKVTLDVQPAYQMRQHVYLDMPMQQVEQHFDDIMGAGYSVSLFTDWQKRRVNEVWVKSRLDAGGTPPAGDFYGARPATENVHPIVELSAENCTEQMGVVGPWYERLPHFRMGFTPSSGKELQAEFFVPRRNAVDALLAVEKLGDRIFPHLLISEIRTIDADELWMSMAYRRPSVAIHFTWKQEPEAVGALLPVIERELAPFDVRPHWGKLFSVSPRDLQKRYERWDDFKALVARYDPRGKFRNAFLTTNLYS